MQLLTGLYSGVIENFYALSLAITSVRLPHAGDILTDVIYIQDFLHHFDVIGFNWVFLGIDLYRLRAIGGIRRAIKPLIGKKQQIVWLRNQEFGKTLTGQGI